MLECGVVPISSYIMDLYRKGWRKHYCKTCQKTTLHKPRTVKRTGWRLGTEYACSECGRVEDPVTQRSKW